MNGGKLHYALREVQDFAGSRHFWIVLAAVVFLFTAISPFGTGEHMALGPRFGFWLVNLTLSTWIAIICVIFANMLLEKLIATPFLRMFAGSLFACLPISLFTILLVYSWRGPAPSWAGFVETLAQALPISMVFMLIFWSSMRHEKQARDMLPATEPAATEPQSPQATAVAEQPPAARTLPEPPPILSRLKPENRGALGRLSAEDHYTLTVTSRGRELLLLRFSDALSEVGETPGAQIHRSHWVARSFLDRLVTKDGKLLARLKDGTELPVSRSFAAEVKSKVASWKA